MSVIEALQHDQLQARKQKNQDVLGVLQMILSQIKNEQITLLKNELTDEEVYAVIRRFVKQQKDALIDFEQAGREDLSSCARQEIELVSRYLPAALGEAEIEAIVQKSIAQIGDVSQKDFGRVMSVVVKEIAGRADGALVQTIVKRTLPSH
jgi:uncharacterized protein YqeY